MKEEEKAIFFTPNENFVCTETFWMFLSDYLKSINSFYFMLHLAHNADTSRLIAAKALVEFEKDESNRKKFQELIENPDVTVSQLKKFSEINSKNIVHNTVDAFIWYVSNVIQQSMRRRPEMIRSAESVTFEEIFSFSNKKQIINYLIDKKINSLSYGGLSKVQQYLEDTLCIAPYRNAHDNELLRVFVEVRNIHTHNRGVVNRIFLDRVGKIIEKNNLKFSYGKKAHLKFDELLIFTKCCVESAMHIDQQVSKKFKIQRKRISTWKEGADF